MMSMVIIVNCHIANGDVALWVLMWKKGRGKGVVVAHLEVVGRSLLFMSVVSCHIANSAVGDVAPWFLYE
jgi:hypothetical protein